MRSQPHPTISADWSPPTNPASERKYGDAAELLHFPTTPELEKRLTDLAQGNLQNIADFFSSCSELSFVFLAFDLETQTTISRSGPSSKAVVEMLRQQPQNKEANTTLCDQTWDAVTLILEELDLLNDFRYILVWRLSDEDCLEFSHSHHFTRKTAWKRVRYHIPEEHQDGNPTNPPTSRQKAKYAVTPAPPTTIIQKPIFPAKTHWPTLINYSLVRDATWRWDRAWTLLKHDIEPSDETDDETTLMAIEFLRSVVENPRCRRLHRMRMPSMFFANKLRIGDTDKRLELECRLLTEQPIDEIAQTFSVKPGTIQAYHDVFFDVRSRLKAKTYILKKVIGKGTGATSLTMENYAKFLAWMGGSVLFEKVWPFLKSGGKELALLTSGEEIRDPFAERLLLLFQALNLPDDHQTQRTLLRLESRLPNRFVDAARSCSFLGVLEQMDDESFIVVEKPESKRLKAQETKSVLAGAA